MDSDKDDIFQIFVNLNYHYCCDCKFEKECDMSQFLCSCERWNQGPPWSKGSEEYNELLSSMADYLNKWMLEHSEVKNGE